MVKSKYKVKPGDIILIHHISGMIGYTNARGVVKYTDRMAIWGTWGSIALSFDDDWEIIDDVENF